MNIENPKCSNPQRSRQKAENGKEFPEIKEKKLN